MAKRNNVCICSNCKKIFFYNLDDNFNNCDICGGIIIPTDYTEEEWNGFSDFYQKHIVDTINNIVDSIESTKDKNLNSDVFSSSVINNTKLNISNNPNNYKNTQRIYENNDDISKSKKVVVTTCDIKKEYEIIKPLCLQLTNFSFKGISSVVAPMLARHKDYLEKTIENYHYPLSSVKDIGNQMKRAFIKNVTTGVSGSVPKTNTANEFYEPAYYLAIEELKYMAYKINADAVIGLRCEFTVDTINNGDNKILFNDNEKYYLRVYGTAVKYLENKQTQASASEQNENI